MRILTALILPTLLLATAPTGTLAKSTTDYTSKTLKSLGLLNYTLCVSEDQKTSLTLAVGFVSIEQGDSEYELDVLTPDFSDEIEELHIGGLRQVSGDSGAGTLQNPKKFSGPTTFTLKGEAQQEIAMNCISFDG